MTIRKINVLDHGYVILNNIAGQVRRPDQEFDASDVDPALAARSSFDSIDISRPREADLKLVKYLMEHKHSGPLEFIDVWLSFKVPIFIARQFHRHRTASINECSARYIQLPSNFYVPCTGDVGVKPENIKQGRDNTQFNTKAEWFNMELTKLNNDSYDLYEKAIENGIPNELARMSLNMNIYTKFEWKQDLHNLMHFLRLRLDSHAQWEAQQYAQAVHDLLDQHLPHAMRLLRKSMK